MPASPERRIQKRLERVARDVGELASRLEELYEERGQLYVEGVELGITQVQLAEWADSTPEAVAKVLRKLREE